MGESLKKLIPIFLHLPKEINGWVCQGLREDAVIEIVILDQLSLWST
jgi:hypothetical protein